MVFEAPPGEPRTIEQLNTQLSAGRQLAELLDYFADEGLFPYPALVDIDDTLIETVNGVAKLQNNAVQFIQGLRDKGYQVVFVTARLNHASTLQQLASLGLWESGADTLITMVNRVFEHFEMLGAVFDHKLSEAPGLLMPKAGEEVMPLDAVSASELLAKWRDLRSAVWKEDVADPQSPLSKQIAFMFGNRQFQIPFIDDNSQVEQMGVDYYPVENGTNLLDILANIPNTPNS